MATFTDETIRQQFTFLAELDHLKSIVRQSPLINQNRKENSAEHSWHLAMFAIVLSQHAENVDVLRVVKLLLVHDIVEIDAGDTPIHASSKDKALLAQAERQAADRIFGLLPPQQGQELLALWLEFEIAETPEARFAKALDRLQPLFLNTLTGGGTWTENGVTERQVIERYGPTIKAGSPALWDEASNLVRQHFSDQAKAQA
ncbi:HD domain-containing protein [Stenotrophobium rhamnosiphilum]|uniref:Hydrolase n=1 Tax=Stenotrophobium rhamnosiphilum TaxID=2029166 RepID=A0A2T5MH38_9GAMM|nr:HD domain-containing protein [Stenotrophobium rhamnosiphilum]PTU31902.1 hydrolase [Stenotrophobium rhamnosiphilum]